MASKTSIKSHQVKVLYWWNQVVRSATTIARKTKVPVSTVHNNLKKLNNKENLNRKKGSGGKRLITSLNEWQNQWLNTTKASKTK
jgi:DNA-binding MarR family transcriptional regulator